jgi:hypothetical protein
MSRVGISWQAYWQLQLESRQKQKQNKLRDFSPQANYTDQATAAFRQS